MGDDVRLNKKTAVIVGIIILTAIICTVIFIKNMKIGYIVYFTNEYGEEIEKAYSVDRTWKWTKEDELKTEEYKQVCIANKRVVPAGIKVVPTYTELINNPYFMLLLIVLAYFIFKCVTEIMTRYKKPSIVKVKIVEPVEVVKNN